MIKAVALGLWICVVTIAGGYFGAVWDSVGNGIEQKALRQPALVKLRSISVPIVRDEKVAGYVIVHFSYLADEEALKETRVKPDAFLIDAIFREVYNAKAPNLSGFAKEDWEGLAKKARATVNTRFAVEVVKDVLLDEFSFLPAGEARKDLSPTAHRKEKTNAEAH